jgi:imidazolonepropionase
VRNLLIKNIKGLVQVREDTRYPLRGLEMATLPILENAFIFLKDGRISDYGSMQDLADEFEISSDVIDASGRFVFPSFVDCHTHLIFAATREDEFVMKIKGASYADIAAKGGGILNSARRLTETSENELYNSAWNRLQEISQTGTGCVEIKSGYGLSLEAELKMLRVARKLQRQSELKIKTTFLGAHAFPAGISREDYVRLIIEEMIPAVAEENLADYIDVFCEDGFFSSEEGEKIVFAGLKAGMKPRIHANQLHRSGGVQLGVKVKALSVDHLENIGEEEINLLSNSEVIATLLPGAAFFLNLSMPPARKLMEAKVPIAIASDYNPGSSPSGNMPLMVSLACIKMKLTPEEAINAATINSAHTLELQNDFGSITRGKVANLFITKPMPSIAYIPYAYGSSIVEKIIINGKAS